MALVTFFPRFLPLAMLSRWTMNPRLKAGLNLMPVAILSSIVFPSLFSSSQQSFTLMPQLLISAAAVVLLVYRFHNLWLGIIAGMLAFWLLGLV
jgi:branched-subunit amino acid transport protein